MGVIAINQQSDFKNVGCSEDIMHTLCSDHHGTPHAVCYPVCVLATSCYDAPITDGEVSPTLCARAGTGGNQLPLITLKNADGTERKYFIRRVTPTECARLQGFPDWWTDGTDGCDTSIYKMWGNGIALPCAADVIGRLAQELAQTT